MSAREENIRNRLSYVSMSHISSVCAAYLVSRYLRLRRQGTTVGTAVERKFARLDAA